MFCLAEIGFIIFRLYRPLLVTVWYKNSKNYKPLSKANWHELIKSVDANISWFRLKLITKRFVGILLLVLS